MDWTVLRKTYVVSCFQRMACDTVRNLNIFFLTELVCTGRRLFEDRYEAGVHNQIYVLMSQLYVCYRVSVKKLIQLYPLTRLLSA
jgi:hypothetical protein